LALEKYKCLKIGRTKLVLFSLLTTGLLTTSLFFIVGELFLFLFGVEPIYYKFDPYVGFASNSPLFVEKQIAGGQKVVATAENKIRYFNDQRFAKEKASGTFRIFCMGGSTTYGRPFDDQTSFCGWLRAYLTAFYPSRLWEVINAGGISYASYRVVRLMEEITQYSPDLFIVYSGHNEFLEARTYAGIMSQVPWLAELDNLLNRTRVYTSLKNVINYSNSTGSEVNRIGRRPQLSSEVDALLDHSIGPDAYHRDAEWRADILAHYRFNLKRMAEIAELTGTQLVFVTPASNLKNNSPFKSEQDTGLTGQQRREWSAIFRQAKRAKRDGSWFEALNYLRQAEAMDPTNADLHYHLGQTFYSLGDFDNAKKAFQRAVDEDVCPLRAVSSMPSMINEVAAQYEVPVVDFIGVLENDSYRQFGHKILGEAYFYDHVHPVIKAHRILAIALMKKFVEMRLVEISPLRNQGVLEETTHAIMRKLDRNAQGRGLKNLAKVFSWAGKAEDASRLAKRSFSILGPDAELYFILGLGAYTSGNLELAITHYKQAISLEPDYVKALNNLGISLAGAGRFDQAVVAYQAVIHLQPEHADAHVNLGNALERMNKPLEAIEHYRLALGINPNDLKLQTLLFNIESRSINQMKAGY